MAERKNETNNFLTWLADAPLFIDGELVRSFYDAVVRPEWKQGSIQVSIKEMEKNIREYGLAAEVELGLGGLIKKVFPFLDAKASAKVEGKKTSEHEETQEGMLELLPIDTPQRQLIQLCLHYLNAIPNRIATTFDHVLEPDFAVDLPRALVFLDLEPTTILIPTAAEVADGSVVTFFPELIKQLRRTDDDEAPKYTEFQGDKEKFSLASKEYWSWYRDRWSYRAATEVIEKAVAGKGRVQWIDYRMPALDGSIHLHVSGRGVFDTGTFAYNTVQRGFKHGLRVVGTLRSEPDLNVMAIFER